MEDNKRKIWSKFGKISELQSDTMFKLSYKMLCVDIGGLEQELLCSFNGFLGDELPFLLLFSMCEVSYTLLHRDQMTRVEIVGGPFFLNQIFTLWLYL